MKRLTKALGRLPALFLALVMIASLIPAAAAEPYNGFEHDRNYHWQVETPSAKQTHTFETSVTTVATCYRTGVMHYKCPTCNYQYDETIPMANHDFETGWTYDNAKHWHACRTSGCGAVSGSAAHTDSSPTVITAATCTSKGSSQYSCTVCGAHYTKETPALGHTAPDSQGRCTRCNQVIQTTPTGNLTVTFKNGLSNFNVQSNLASGASPSNPGTPSYPSPATGCSYVFKGWTTTDPGSKAMYVNQTLVSPTTSVTSSTTYYAVYTVSASNQNISSTGATSRTVGGDISSGIGSKLSAITGWSSFNTVRFSNPKSTAYGTLYADSYRTTLSVSSAYTASAISSLYFIPGSTAGYTIDYIAEDAYKNTISGTITLSGTSTADASVITYYVAPGSTVDFKNSDFVTAYNKLCGGVNGALRYVTFSVPSGYSSFDGSLYSGSLPLTERRLDGSTFYYGSNAGDYALNSLNFQADRDARNGDVLTFPCRLCYSNSVSYPATVQVVISKNGSDGVVTYRVAPGQSVRFDRSDFNNAYQDLSGYTSRTIRYVAFDAGRDYTSFSGKISAAGHSDFTRDDLSYKDETFYYSSSSYGDYALEDLSFRASSSAKNGDTLTIPFRAYYDKDTYEEGTLKLIIDKNGSEDTIEVEAAPGSTVRLDRGDFNDVYRALTGTSSGTLRYVAFEAPSSYTNFPGRLYAGSTALTRTDLQDHEAWFYYNSSDAGSRDYVLNDLSFQADSDAKVNSTISIPFWAYYGNDGSVEGVLKISIVSSKGDLVSYNVAPGGSVDLKADDFNAAYRAMSGNDNRTISYVAFEAPATYGNFSGKLYTGPTALTRTDLAYNRTTFYYSNSRYGTYALTSLSFKADASARNGDTISIPFRAYYSDNNGDYEEGTLKITIGNTTGDIPYTVVPGKTVNFDRGNFQTFLQKTYPNESLSYVVFQKPGTGDFADNDGTFYSGYGTSYAKFFSRDTLAGSRFYYNSSDAGTRDYLLNDLSFAAASSFKGKVTLRFTAYSTGNRSVDGTVVIQPTSTTTTSTVTASIRYNTTTGTALQINADDIAVFYKSANPGDTLQYVTLNDVPTAGGLYYNYYNASAYGTTAREQLTAANRTQRSFYLNPTAATQYSLRELTYVPSGSNYCASIPFTAYGTGGRSTTGSILISITSSLVSEVYGVSPKNTPVTFPASALYTAITTATGSALSGIQLLSLPAATVGTVYAGTGTTPANTSTVYTYSGGTQQMGQLRFVPATNYTGSVEIPYLALNANGVPLASGTFSLGVLNANKRFTDVSASTWCYKYVMELADTSVIGGYPDGSFKPNSTITYGAALKLVMLAAGYPEQPPVSGGSTFSGYLARAQADGLITRSNVNLSAPITRLQVAQLAAGALKLDINNLPSTKPFTDTSDVYVQALNAAGIVGGYFSNGTSTYKPGNTLTRGQVSAIVWRMQNYRKR